MRVLSSLFPWLASSHASPGPDRARLAAIEWREFAPAEFSWSSPDRTLNFTVQLAGMRVECGVASVELSVLEHDLEIVSVIEGNKDRAVLYLGNYFIVPPPLRRRGLASAALMASLQTFQHAAFGRTLPAQQVRLQGYLVGDGAKFARAACNGIEPTKAAPAAIDLHWLQSRARHLTMDRLPVSNPLPATGA